MNSELRGIYKCEKRLRWPVVIVESRKYQQQCSYRRCQWEEAASCVDVVVFFFLARRVAARKIKGATLRPRRDYIWLSVTSAQRPALRSHELVYICSVFILSTTYSTRKSTQLPARATAAYTPSSANRVIRYRLHPVTTLLQPAIHCYVPPSIDIGRFSPLNYNSQHHSAGPASLIKLNPP